MPLSPSSAYKDLKTSRGLNYHYYHSPAAEGKRTLVLIHGFPSTSYDWRNQVAFFKEKGYGLIVPDMLGYGGTAKPLDPAEYKASLITKDIADILDAENVDKAVIIGHDWGSRVTSRFAQRYPERVEAIAVLAVGYQAPTPQFDYEKVLAMSKQLAGYEVVGYWEYFSRDETVKVIEENREKFTNALFPDDPKLWVTDVAPRGAFENYMTNKPAVPAASWLPAAEFKEAMDDLFAGGMAAPLHWYKYILSKHNTDDDSNIPQENAKISKPVFFGAAMKDYIAIAPAQIHQTKALAENLTVKQFDTGHWVQLEKPNEVNSELEAWLGQL